MNRLPANQKHRPSRTSAGSATRSPSPATALQVDVKFLERIAGTRKRLYQFTAIDDCTRIRVLKVYDACNQGTAIRFIDEVLRRLPFRVTSSRPTTAPSSSRASTGTSRASTSATSTSALGQPHLNGKVERSHRVDDQEFYQLLDKDGITDDIHLFNDKLREWEDYYNYHRPHGGLDGQTPYERLLAKNESWPVSPTS